MVYRIRLTLLAVVLVMLVLGFIALRHDFHSAKLWIAAKVGPMPTTVWAFAVEGMKDLFGIIETNTMQMLAQQSAASANGVNHA